MVNCYQTYSDWPEAYAVGEERWSRGLQFYKEAKRLLDEEDGKVTIAYVQGMGVLYVWYVVTNLVLTKKIRSVNNLR